MGKKKNGYLSTDFPKKRRFPFIDIIAKERTFFLLLCIAFAVAGIFTGNTQVAMWLGFTFAAYAAIANDSIQTIGTFLGSNADKKWWVLWLFVGLIFIAVVTFSFITFDGDVTYQRLLSTDGKTKYPHPDKFSYLQIIAPLILLILTRMRMPVSTTFLLLSSFSADSSGVTSVLGKSLSGYVMAFILSAIVWLSLYKLIRKYFKQREMNVGWMVAQWVISGTLWAVWLMQDAANISVYLPRRLDLGQFLVFTAVIFFGLGLLFYLRGDKIQGIVTEKTRIGDVRAATLVDATYAILLVYKLTISTVPMSTTWVFLGVIGGRELAISFMRKKKGKKHKKKAVRMISKDMAYALIGLLVSVLLAVAVNPLMREEFARALFD